MSRFEARVEFYVAAFFAGVCVWWVPYLFMAPFALLVTLQAWNGARRGLVAHNSVSVLKNNSIVDGCFGIQLERSVTQHVIHGNRFEKA